MIIIKGKKSGSCQPSIMHGHIHRLFSILLREGVIDFMALYPSRPNNSLLKIGLFMLMAAGIVGIVELHDNWYLLLHDAGEWLIRMFPRP